MTGLVFHCWNGPGVRIFAEWASQNGFYMQYVNIGRPLSNMERSFHPHFKGQFFTKQTPRLGVFLDMNCAQSAYILNMSSVDRLFNDNFHWLLYERSGDIAPFRQFAEGANFYVNSDVTYILPGQPVNTLQGNNTNERYFTLYDVYNNGAHIGGRLNITIDRSIRCNESDCTIDRYLSPLHKRTVYGNRDSQRDITLRIATVITVIPLSSSVSEKMEFLLSNNNTYIDPVPRFGFRQTMVLMDMLYCKYNLTFFDRWAVNDVFGGSLNSVIDGHSDMGSTPTAMTTYRLKHLKILSETGLFNSICLFRTPLNTANSDGGQAFLEPFSPTVWKAFGIILLITAIQLWTIFFVELHRMPKGRNYAPSLLTSCLITLGTACIQGSYVLPRSFGGRTTYTILALAAFIMYNYYTSVIVATLLGSPAKSNIRTVGQLADSSLEVGFEPRPYIYSYLNSTQVPAVRRLVKKKIENRKNPYSAWVPVIEGILRVRDEIGTFAYVFEASTGLALVENYYKPEEICDLNVVRLRPETSLANQLPKNSTFRKLFRLRLMRMVETGINRRIVKYWLRDRFNCFSSNTIVVVGLEYTAPLFFLILLFYLISLIVLVVEILIHRFIGSQRAIERLCL